MNGAALGPKALEHLAILEQAMVSPQGLLLQTSDLTKARAALYTARRISGDIRFSSLQFRSVNLPDGNLAITHGTKEPFND